MGSIPVAGANRKGHTCVPFLLAKAIGMRIHMQASDKQKTYDLMAKLVLFRTHGVRKMGSDSRCTPYFLAPATG